MYPVLLATCSFMFYLKLSVWILFFLTQPQKLQFTSWLHSLSTPFLKKQKLSVKWEEGRERRHCCVWLKKNNTNVGWWWCSSKVIFASKSKSQCHKIREVQFELRWERWRGEWPTLSAWVRESVKGIFYRVFFLGTSHKNWICYCMGVLWQDEHSQEKMLHRSRQCWYEA